MIKKEIVKTIELNNNSNLFDMLLKLSEINSNDVRYKVKDGLLILYRELELSEEETVLHKIKLLKEQNKKTKEKIEQLYKRIRIEEEFYKENYNEINKLLSDYSNVINKK